MTIDNIATQQYSLPSADKNLAALRQKNAVALNENDQQQNDANAVEDQLANAFEAAAQKTNAFLAADMRIQLFLSNDDTTETVVERALLLRSTNVSLGGDTNVEAVLRQHNAILAAKGEPLMNADEEQQLTQRIQTIANLRVDFLNQFISALQKEPFNIAG